jgi:hypothetical protein
MQIEIKCAKHPRYEAKRYPTAEGCACRLIWRLLNNPQQLSFSEHVMVRRQQG